MKDRTYFFVLVFLYEHERTSKLYVREKNTSPCLLIYTTSTIDMPGRLYVLARTALSISINQLFYKLFHDATMVCAMAAASWQRSNVDSLPPERLTHSTSSSTIISSKERQKRPPRRHSQPQNVFFEYLLLLWTVNNHTRLYVLPGTYYVLILHYVSNVCVLSSH